MSTGKREVKCKKGVKGRNEMIGGRDWKISVKYKSCKVIFE
jgi:hypothetical protein